MKGHSRIDNPERHMQDTFKNRQSRETHARIDNPERHMQDTFKNRQSRETHARHIQE